MPIDLRPNDRGGYAPMPPMQLIECQPIREAVGMWEKAQQVARAANRDAAVLEQGRQGAVDEDTMALADAIERGGKDPGQKHVDEYDQKIASAQRRAAATAIVADRAFDALREAIAVHQGDWAEIADQKREAARLKLCEAVDATAVAAQEFASAAGIASYVATGRWKVSQGIVPLRRTGGDHTANVPDLLDALRVLGQPAQTATQTTQIVGGLRTVEMGRDRDAA